jgi:hypothetical protein
MSTLYDSCSGPQLFADEIGRVTDFNRNEFALGQLVKIFQDAFGHSEAALPIFIGTGLAQFVFDVGNAGENGTAKGPKLNDVGPHTFTSSAFTQRQEAGKQTVQDIRGTTRSLRIGVALTLGDGCGRGAQKTPDSATISAYGVLFCMGGAPFTFLVR